MSEDLDSPIPVALTEKALQRFAGQSVEVRDKTSEEELWGVTRIILHINDGTIPDLPPRVEPIRVTHWVDARRELAMKLRLDPNDIEIGRIR